MADQKFVLIGIASGIAGADEHSGDGPLTMRHSPRLSGKQQLGVEFEWREMLQAKAKDGKRLDDAVADACKELAHLVSPLIKSKQKFCIVGGDHSCAVGTWSGVYDALHEQGDLGLIWIDAHMDSHTPETSESGNIHGMPLAALLGYGYPALTSILSYDPKLKPENVCLIGVRSFEEGEAALLERLNVRVYFMDEVKERGFDAVLKDAIELVTKNTTGYGVSLDIDCVDPEDAPGVDVPEPDGIRADDLCAGLKQLYNDPKLLTCEVVEFDPTRDVEKKTEHLVADVLQILATGQKG